MTAEFVLDLDEGMLEYFRDMADVLVDRCGISRPEAVARINRQYADLEIAPYPDLMCHEAPEFWALPAYYGRGDHLLPPDRRPGRRRPHRLLPPAGPSGTCPGLALLDAAAVTAARGRG
ncbi:hypothetical protein ACGV4K_28910 [Streptomyces sp. WAC8370]|uniref:hypothetical protein n=1 Tax=Streptomyces sp. WAC8370 TaxID=3351348 RepID=UPI003F7AA8AC